ncbi:HNH endonuclease [Burkholderia gladioli]|uniref:HNH endonuclease n=1 Tax=Burkholderia TaxID=32008 RepID=UPI0011A3D896
MPTKSGVPMSLRRKVFREEGYCCAECGLVGWEERFPRGGYGYYTAVTGVYLSIDHIVPRSRGGSGDRSNLRVLCNTRKGTKLLPAPEVVNA